MQAHNHTITYYVGHGVRAYNGQYHFNTNVSRVAKIPTYFLHLFVRPLFWAKESRTLFFPLSATHFSIIISIYVKAYFLYCIHILATDCLTFSSLFLYVEETYCCCCLHCLLCIPCIMVDSTLHLAASATDWHERKNTILRWQTKKKTHRKMIISKRNGLFRFCSNWNIIGSLLLLASIFRWKSGLPARAH